MNKTTKTFPKPSHIVKFVKGKFVKGKFAKDFESWGVSNLIELLQQEVSLSETEDLIRWDVVKMIKSASPIALHELYAAVQSFLFTILCAFYVYYVIRSTGSTGYDLRWRLLWGSWRQETARNLSLA